MTWVEWYAGTLVFISVVANIALEGETVDTTTFGAKRLVSTLVLNAPIYGRVFGWW